MYGALSGSLDWSTGDLHCAGMPRPGGAGARLRFAGVANDGGQAIAIILALPQLAKDATGREFASNVTLIEEGSGRFFSTINTDNCLTDIVSLTAIDGSDDRYSIQGKTYCISPLAEVNGTSSVSLPELHFTGLIDWSSS